MDEDEVAGPGPGAGAGAGGAVTANGARRLVDELVAAQRVLARAQAGFAGLVCSFADARRGLDRQLLGGVGAGSGKVSFRAGEFAAAEISMAVHSSRYTVARLIGMTRRVRAEAPEVWDAWVAGDVDADRVLRINRALRRLVRDSSKQLLNAVVVDVAASRSPEVLGRWLNQFIVQTEPDLQDERLRRSFADRYVSVRPDVDGISFLSAALSSVDAQAVDRVLTALAGAAEPGDVRTVRQRRADALVDVLCGRVSNGCHVSWDTNRDTDDHLDDDPTDQDDETHPDQDDSDRGDSDRGDEATNSDGHLGEVNTEPQGTGDGSATDTESARGAISAGGSDQGGRGAGRGEPETADSNDGTRNEPDWDSGDWDAGGWDAGDWDAVDWDLPASAFRPDPRAGRFRPDPSAGPPDDTGRPDPVGTEGFPVATSRTGGYPPGAARVLTCGGGGGGGGGGDGDGADGNRGGGGCTARPVPVTIGIVVTAASLFGATDTPGELMDRSASVPAGVIRELAHQPGTLFYRLLTDPEGNLLDVTELGRFPSRKLGIAVRFRDGTCTAPSCTVHAAGCDLDHVVPAPQGPTAAVNLKTTCRPDHRAKTYAGHRSARTGPHTSEWTTPTGHRYVTQDQPFLVEDWPDPDPGESREPGPQRDNPRRDQPRRDKPRRDKPRRDKTPATQTPTTEVTMRSRARSPRISVRLH